MNRNLLSFLAAAGLGALVGCGGSGSGSGDEPGVVEQDPRVSRSSPIQLSADGSILYVVNKVASPELGAGVGSLTVVRVRDEHGADTQEILTEVAVGQDPFSVSLNAAGTRAFVSNGGDNTVTVYDLGNQGSGPFSRVTDVVVGSEPRGTAVLGQELYVAQYTDGELLVLDTDTLLLIDRIALGDIDKPFGVTALPSGDIWVTNFFAKPVAGKSADEVEAFDDGKAGMVAVVRNRTLQSVVTLDPLADSGFAADRSAFDPANGAINDTFQAPDGVDPTAVPQGAYFNQLTGLAYDEARGRFYLPSIGAQPEPPVRFNVNVQSLVGVIDAELRAEVPQLAFNVNQLIRENFDVEAAPPVPFLDPETRLDRAFFADLTALDVQGDRMALVSRAGSYLVSGSLDAQGAFTLDRDDRGAIRRIPTANLPFGIVLNETADRAYAVSELVGEVSVIDLADGAALLAIETAGTPIDPRERGELLGKLAFFTGMGLPHDADALLDPRDVDTHRFRNMASDNNWSSCASCHPGGRADGVTWSFPTGPRQSISMEGFFALGSTVESDFATTDQKVSNWNGVRGSVTDFNNNARNVQGGFGFTPEALATIDDGGEPGDVPDRTLIFNHGPRLGVSGALDRMTEWVTTVRPLNRPSDLDALAVARGRNLFVANCAECHGGTKWTRSDRVLDLVRWPDPAFDAGGNPLTPNLLNPAATVLKAFDSDDDGIFETAIVRDDVGAETLDPSNPIEIRGLGGLIGQASAGAGASFVPPSLFGVQGSAPYGHHGRAQGLGDVFEPIVEGGLGHPAPGLSLEQLADILIFVQAIDAEQPLLP